MDFTKRDASLSVSKFFSITILTMLSASFDGILCNLMLRKAMRSSHDLFHRPVWSKRPTRSWSRSSRSLSWARVHRIDLIGIDAYSCFQSCSTFFLPPVNSLAVISGFRRRIKLWSWNRVKDFVLLSFIFVTSSLSSRCLYTRFFSFIRLGINFFFSLSWAATIQSSAFIQPPPFVIRKKSPAVFACTSCLIRAVVPGWVNTTSLFLACSGETSLRHRFKVPASLYPASTSLSTTSWLSFSIWRSILVSRESFAVSDNEPSSLRTISCRNFPESSAARVAGIYPHFLQPDSRCAGSRVRITALGSSKIVASSKATCPPKRILGISDMPTFALLLCNSNLFNHICALFRSSFDLKAPKTWSNSWNRVPFGRPG